MNNIVIPNKFGYILLNEKIKTLLTGTNLII